MSYASNLKKSLGSFFLLWIGVASALSTIIIFDESKDTSELWIVVHLAAFAPVMIFEAVLYTFIDARQIGKVSKVLIFASIGMLILTLLTTFLLELAAYPTNTSAFVFIGSFFWVIHAAIGSKLPWRKSEWL